MEKPWQVFGAGLSVLVLYVSLIANPAIAYALVSLVLFSLFTAGFFFQPESEVFVVPFVPAGKSEASEADFIIGEAVPPVFDGQQLDETYPQHFFFQVELRRIWLLATTAFIPVAVLIWLWRFGQVPSLGGFPPMELTILPLYIFGGVWLVMRKWLRERRLLRRALVGWAPFYRDTHTQGLIYQFFDCDGERRGGIHSDWTSSLHPADNISLVFANPNEPDDSLLGCGFVFHSFRLIEARHAPETLRQEL